MSACEGRPILQEPARQLVAPELAAPVAIVDASLVTALIAAPLTVALAVIALGDSVAQFVAVVAQAVAQPPGHFIGQPLGGKHAAGALNPVTQLPLVETVRRTAIREKPPRLALGCRGLIERPAGYNSAGR